MMPTATTSRCSMDANDAVTSWNFIKQSYRPDDRVALVIRNRHEDYTLQRLLSA
jgi:hypothetical protein